MNDLMLRCYVPNDFAACLTIFDSNVPAFFTPDERAEFCSFLNCRNPVLHPYLVLTRKERVIASGGLMIDLAKRQASLSWGMVGRADHGQGAGRRLTQARIAMARDVPGLKTLTLATSQHTRGFYEKSGFVVVGVTPDGFGRDLDRCDMTLCL